MRTIYALTAHFILAVSTFGQTAQYEAAPNLRASDILKPEYLEGPNHKVLDRVSTGSGRNRYTLETPWGYLTADGDMMLRARVAETRAIAELENVSRTDEFKAGLKGAAVAPLNAVKGIVESPVGAVKGTAQGVWKFMNRAGEGVKNVAQGRQRGQGEDNLGKSLLGFSKIKRELALQLGCDPYSSNEILQEQLDTVAWVKTGGVGVFKVATLPIGGGAGLALTATETTNSFQQSLRDLSPADLRLANKKDLMAMGVSSRGADDFLANRAFSPTHQTAFVHALRAMKGVKGREAFVSLATTTSVEEGDAQFCSGTAQLLAALHTGDDKMDRITTLGDFPVAIAADGRLVVALQWDTAFWSENVEKFVDRASAAKLGQTGPLVIAITGNATQLAKDELAKRKVGLLVNALGGPQK